MKEFMNNAWRPALVAMVSLVSATFNAQADTFTFGPSQYDNTANTVTGTNGSPVYTNNQTTGSFRDVIWWGPAYNGGTAGVGSPDFINAGKNLISNGGTPARAVVGGQYDALNFTGVRIPNGGASFLTIYDTTPGDGTATRSLFDATGGLQISADVLFAPGQHAASGGVVALYNEGQDALALLATNRGGNNQDEPKLSLVWQSLDTGTVLDSTLIPASSFQGDTNSSALLGDHWYRVVMNLLVTGDTWTMNGFFYNHSDPTNPNSALGSQIAALTHSGSLSDPNPTPGLDRALSNPGQVGLMAQTRGPFSDGVANGGTGANPLVDNVGVSITNFTIPTPVPEPSSVMLLGTATAFTGYALRRRASKRLRS